MDNPNSWTNPQVIIAIGGVMTTMIGAIAGAVVIVVKAIRESRETVKQEVRDVNSKVDAAAVKVVESDRKNDAIISKADEIHKTVNGKNDALQAKNDVLQAEILKLTQEKAAQAEKLSELLYTKFSVDRRKVVRKR